MKIFENSPASWGISPTPSQAHLPKCSCRTEILTGPRLYGNAYLKKIMAKKAFKVCIAPLHFDFTLPHSKSCITGLSKHVNAVGPRFGPASVEMGPNLKMQIPRRRQDFGSGEGGTFRRSPAALPNVPALRQQILKISKRFLNKIAKNGLI